jgi:hypothetical protein
MDIEDFKKTEYFNWMLSQADKIELELASFNKEYNGLIEGENKNLSEVLRSHLVIEYYIDRYLTLAIPEVEDWEQLRLTFSKKLEIINNKRTSIAMLYPALKALNKLRNNYAHNLNYKPNTDDYEPITNFITIWYSAMKKNIPLNFYQLIQQFTLMVAAFIDVYIKGIENHTPNDGILGYLAFIEEKMKIKSSNDS